MGSINKKKDNIEYVNFIIGLFKNATHTLSIDEFIKLSHFIAALNKLKVQNGKAAK